MDVVLSHLSVYIILIFSLLLNSNICGEVCKISNLQIHSEDGRQQYIELNLKKVDIDNDNACPGCKLSEDSIRGVPSHSRWTSTPPSFSLVFIPAELMHECDSIDKKSLPLGFCSGVTPEVRGENSICSNNVCSMEDIEDLAEDIENKHLIPLNSGSEKLHHRIATAIVLLNLGNLNKAIEEFSAVIEEDPEVAIAYFGRGAAYYRKGLNVPSHVSQALSDFNKAIKLDVTSSRPYVYLHRAEIFLMLQRYKEAYDDTTAALKVKPLPKIYFLRGIVSLLSENFSDAETDFRQNLQCSDTQIRTMSHFHLGLALYYKGKVRNAIEVFKEVLKENSNHTDASLSMAQGFKELGNTRAALLKFNHILEAHPNHTMAYQLRGIMIYQTGDMKGALYNFEKCLQLDQTSASCLYMKGASKIMQGQFYSGVKDTTRLMVSNIPSIKASPEYIKAHYLREYARYVHARLDNPVSSIQPDVGFSPSYLDLWDKLKRFNFKNYKEQPGLQPDIRDVKQLKSIPEHLMPLFCRADALGKLSQVGVDGILPNRRLNIAMGLAAIHIAQHLELKWKTLKSSKTNSNDKLIHGWKELFEISVYYRRLANLDESFLWVDSVPDYYSEDGYRSDIPFVRGSTTNTKVTPYHELAFKLAKTMLEHYGEGAVAYPGLKEDIAKASTCEDLLNVARRRQINQHGFLVSTQVPSMLHMKEDYRLDGGVLVLTEDLSQRIVFTLNIANTPERTLAYSAEMDHLIGHLQEEIRKLGTNKVSDMDTIMSHILSIVYYFYNLIPLTKGSSAVAYSVMLGLFMSVGRQITGRIPNGRLLDMEAMLSGAPDAFVMVVKSWMSIKKNSVPVSSMPKVWEVLPTVRSVLEVLSVNATIC